MRRHYANLEAVLEYDHCSMHYFYKRIAQVKEINSTALEWKTIVQRSLKSLAREKLRLGFITQEKATLIWTASAKNTSIETKPKLNSKGRSIVYEFRDWLSSINVLGMALPRSIPIKLLKEETLELRTTVDISIEVDKQIKFIRIADHNNLESAVLATDEVPWLIFSPSSNTWISPDAKPWLSGILKEISRGMFRSIIWPHKDGRCSNCPYNSICSPLDVGSSANKVAKRIGG